MSKIPGQQFYQAKLAYAENMHTQLVEKYKALLKKVIENDNGKNLMSIPESADVLIQSTSIHAEIVTMRLVIKEIRATVIYEFDEALREKF